MCRLFQILHLSLSPKIFGVFYLLFVAGICVVHLLSTDVEFYACKLSMNPLYKARKIESFVSALSRSNGKVHSLVLTFTDTYSILSGLLYLFSDPVALNDCFYLITSL